MPLYTVLRVSTELTWLLLSHPTPTPHVLQQPIPLRQPVQRVIPLAHSPHKATQRIDLVFARVATVFIDFANGDLDGGVVFGFDDAVGCAAFAGDVARGLDRSVLLFRRIDGGYFPK